MNSTNYTQFIVSLKFVSASDSTYSFSPIQINYIDIDQKADTSYSDDIRVELTISMADYANMYAHIQDLHAILKISFCDITGALVSTATPVVKRYRAAMIDPRDMHRQYVDVATRSNEFDTKIHIRLIEDEVVTARGVEINTIFPRCSIEDAVHTAMSTFGFSALTMVAPDNTHIYDHILVPPTKSFSTFLPWLQAKYGIYMAGICHYYTNNHLFIYAPFDTAPTTESTLVVYQAEEGMYAGASNFSRKVDTKYEVVTNKIVHATDLSTYGSENVGTSVMFLRSSEMVDGVVQPDAASGIKFNDDVVLNISLNSPRTLNAQQNKTIYAHATDNPFSLASHIVEHQATLIEFQWAMSVPFVLRPGLAVLYYSDKAGVVEKRTGIIERVNMRVQRMELASSGRIYKATANVTVRLQPEGTTTTDVVS